MRKTRNIGILLMCASLLLSNNTALATEITTQNVTTQELSTEVTTSTEENTSEVTTELATENTEATTEATTEISTEQNINLDIEVTTEETKDTVVEDNSDNKKDNKKKPNKKIIKEEIELEEEDEEDKKSKEELKKKYLKQAAADAKYYITWKQCSPAWGDEIVKNSGNTMTKGACSTTSQAIIIKMSGYAKNKDFTPLSYMRWAEKNGQQFINSMLCTPAVSAYTNGNLQMVKSVRDNKYDSSEEIYKLAKWGYDNGYYMIMHISHTKGGGHFMPVVGFDTKNKKVYVNEVGKNTLTGLLDFAGYFGEENPDEIMDGIDFYKCSTSTFKDFNEKGEQYIIDEVEKLRKEENARLEKERKEREAKIMAEIEARKSAYVNENYKEAEEKDKFPLDTIIKSVPRISIKEED